VAGVAVGAAPVRVAAIVAGLTRSLWSIEDARVSTGIPRQPGFYAWWTVPGAVLRVAAPRHPSEPFELLYVGIAPQDAVSNQRLRSRLCRQHIAGNVASSTFRFGLGALLWETESWTPRCTSSGRYRLDREDNTALSRWQREHLRLAWFVIPDPWRSEDKVIESMKPPMRREHNQKHPYYEKMGDARERFREAARRSSDSLSEIVSRKQRRTERTSTPSDSRALQPGSSVHLPSVVGTRLQLGTAPMPQSDPYPINAAELARRLAVDGKRLRDVLRTYPELVPGHLPNARYRISLGSQSPQRAIGPRFPTAACRAAHRVP
jgi:GIY-YIG catalytic domain